jgi:N-acetylated-alpha-linked acidic dipeptidase
VSGSRFQIRASPSLADIARTVASNVPHPTHVNRTLWEMRNDHGPFSGPIALDIQQLYDNSLSTSSRTGIGALGSGSDYTVRFLLYLLTHLTQLD